MRDIVGLLLLDQFAVALGLGVVHRVLRGAWEPTPLYLNVAITFLSIWFAISLLSQKYDGLLSGNPRVARRRVVAAALVATLGFMLAASMSPLWAVSRRFLAIAIAMALTVNFLMFLAMYGRRAFSQGDAEDALQREDISFGRLLAGLAILLGTFAAMSWIKAGAITVYPRTETLLAMLVGAWAAAAIATRKYHSIYAPSVFYYVAPCLKAGMLMLLFVSGAFFFMRLEELSRFLLFGTTGASIVVETLTWTIWYKGHRSLAQGRRMPSTTSATTTPEEFPATPPSDDYSLAFAEALMRLDVPNARSMLLFFHTLPSEAQGGGAGFRVLSVEESGTVQAEAPASLSVLMNVRPLNRIQSLNVYLAACHSRLVDGGRLFGCFQSLHDARESIRKRTPGFLYPVVLFTHFIFLRVAPRLPLSRVAYAGMSGDRRLVLSRAEAFGRLAYAGFTVREWGRIGGQIYFVADKTHAPYSGVAPSFGPLIRLRRVGYHGQMIEVYKLRTMHPYSEFIQKEVYEHNNLDPSGKLHDDFRVTNWGRVLRRLWIDEVPQVINWIRGDLRLVGVRALSEHYLSLYPDDLQELRQQTKPGLVPPYYADMPRGFDEIVESERRYLEEKRAHPIETDMRYLARAFGNIVFHGARSK